MMALCSSATMATGRYGASFIVVAHAGHAGQDAGLSKMIAGLEINCPH